MPVREILRELVKALAKCEKVCYNITQKGISALKEEYNVSFLSQNGVSSVASDTIVIVFLALTTVASIVAAVVFLCKFAGDDGEVAHRKSALAVLLAVGFILRLVFGLCVRGYREDYKVFTDMFGHLDDNGVGSYYKGDAASTLYPLVYFVYLIFGGLSNVTGLSDFALGTQFMVKLPLIIADLSGSFAIYKIASKYFNRKIALTLCAFVCVSPIFFIGSSLWTTPLVFTVMFACFACYFLARRNYAATIAFATCSAFSSKEGIYIFVAVAVFSVYHFVRAVGKIRSDKPDSKQIRTPDYNAVYTVPSAIVLSFLGAYLICLFSAYSFSLNPFVYIYEFLLEPLLSWRYFTYNGLSVYSLFNRNGVAPVPRFPSGVFFGIFFAIIAAVVCVVYFSKRNRATMVMLAAYSAFTMLTYYPGATAMSMQSALLLVLAAYALVKDKRLLSVLFVTGLAFVINSCSVLANAGYLNNLADYSFTTADYTGSTLMSGGIGAVTIVCAALTVIAHLYFTVVTISVGMTGQKKMLMPADGLAASAKEYFDRRKAS